MIDIKNIKGYAMYERFNKIDENEFEGHSEEEIEKAFKARNIEIAHAISDINNECARLKVPVNSEYHNMLRENSLEAILQFVKRDGAVIKAFCLENDIDWEEL